jgi:hypothetical protein
MPPQIIETTGSGQAAIDESNTAIALELKYEDEAKDRKISDFRAKDL